MDGNGHDRSVFPWRGRVLTEADLPDPRRLDDRIPEPTECRFNVAWLEGTKNESASLKRSFHLDGLLGKGQSSLGIEVSRSARGPRHLKGPRGEKQGESL